MKKIISLICLIACAGALLAAVVTGRELPLDTRPYVEMKYAGWSGVLRVWVYAGWETGEKLSGWLNRCASTFEKQHEGVYVEFEFVSADAILFMNTSGIALPDLICYPPGLLSQPIGLLTLKNLSKIHPALRMSGERDGLLYAAPILMSGYSWAYNRARAGEFDPNLTSAEFQILPDETHSKYSAALIGLLSARGRENNLEDNFDNNMEIPEIGIDLGLPTLSDVDASVFSDEAFQNFCAGKCAATAVSRRELSALQRRADQGREPDWAMCVTGDCAYTDQVLYLSVVEGETQRNTLSRELIDHLLTENCQKTLAKIGLISVDEALYGASNSAYSALEAGLKARPLIVPNCFSEYWQADTPSIVRDLLNGKITGPEAVDQLKALLY